MVNVKIKKSVNLKLFPSGIHITQSSMWWKLLASV
jgi:hypothetical protein